MDTKSVIARFACGLQQTELGAAKCISVCGIEAAMTPLCRGFLP
jgi:hypothetical protein